MIKQKEKFTIDYQNKIFKEYQQTGSNDSLCKIIESVQDLIYSIINKTIRNKNNIEICEVFNDVILDIIPEFKRYNPEKTRISTFLYNRVKYATIKSLHSKGIIRVPEKMYNILYKVNRFISEYMSENGIDPNIDLISKKLNIKKSKIEYLMPIINKILSLDYIVDSHSERECYNYVVIDKTQEIDNKIKRDEIIEALKEMVREKKIQKQWADSLFKYYFEGKTLEQISALEVNRFGKKISKQRIEQRISKARDILSKDNKFKNFI